LRNRPPTLTDIQIPAAKTILQSDFHLVLSYKAPIMKSSNLQLRKISLIEFLLGIQDEEVFDKLESTIHKSLKSVKPTDFVFSREEVAQRAEFSNNQIKKGLVLSQKELEAQSKKW
jgi:hypothetical protein